VYRGLACSWSGRGAGWGDLTGFGGQDGSVCMAMGWAACGIVVQTLVKVGGYGLLKGGREWPIKTCGPPACWGMRLVIGTLKWW
jgi:hypothetical protein